MATTLALLHVYNIIVKTIINPSSIHRATRSPVYFGFSIKDLATLKTI